MWLRYSAMLSIFGDSYFWICLMYTHHTHGTPKTIKPVAKPVPDNWMTTGPLLLLSETSSQLRIEHMTRAEHLCKTVLVSRRRKMRTYKWLWAAFNPY